MFEHADAIDMREGLLAYQRYNKVIQTLADKYNQNLSCVVAAFCALSPNNDYWGNLRSLVSILDGIQKGVSVEEINVSTYRHCLIRAYGYFHGEIFTEKVKGPKITNFFWNVLLPQDNRFVTVDGHISAIWQGKRITMKEAIISKRKYEEIADAIKQLAFQNFMIPNQYQATLWFTRKRIFNIKAENQFDAFLPRNDQWKTLRDIDSIKPYPALVRKQKKQLHKDQLRLMP